MALRHTNESFTLDLGVCRGCRVETLIEELSDGLGLCVVCEIAGSCPMGAIQADCDGIDRFCLGCREMGYVPNSALASERKVG